MVLSLNCWLVFCEAFCNSARCFSLSERDFCVAARALVCLSCSCLRSLICLSISLARLWLSVSDLFSWATAPSLSAPALMSAAIFLVASSSCRVASWYCACKALRCFSLSASAFRASAIAFSLRSCSALYFAFSSAIAFSCSAFSAESSALAVFCCDCGVCNRRRAIFFAGAL
ncbi:hypothetical protein D3C80_799710 [compost metagenome]